MYHEYDPPTWEGATGFYSIDHRKPLIPQESKTWSPVHVWATPTYPDDMMSWTMAAHPYFTPPADRSYLLELLSVPEGIDGAPAVGTVWEVPLDQPFTVTVPTYRSEDGLEAYQFAFTMTAVPEPGSVFALAVGGLFLCKTRRRR